MSEIYAHTLTAHHQERWTREAADVNRRHRRRALALRRQARRRNAG